MPAGKVEKLIPTETGEALPFDASQYSLPEILRPEGTALLVVDVQNDFLSPHGFFAKHNWETAQMRSIIEPIQGLIDAAHVSKIPVIFTRGYEDVKLRQKGPDRRRAIQWEERDGNGSVNSESGTWGSELYGLTSQEGDVVVEKHQWSAFNGNDSQDRSLKQILDQLGVRTLVVVGVVAETCIETTVRDAYSQGYFVVVAEHSVGSNDPVQLEARMKYWKAGFIGDVVDEAEIEGIWKKTSDDSAPEKM